MDGRKFMSTSEYKYWLYYFRNETIDDYYLYAYTDDKEIHELFESQRDMDKFYVKKTKLSRDEATSLSETHRNNFLTKVKYRTTSCDKERYCELAITLDEKLSTVNYVYQQVYVDILTKAIIDPEIFQEKYLNILHKFGYSYAYYGVNSTKYDKELMYEYFFDNVYPDYLGGFVFLYGKTLKTKGW